MKFTVHNTGNYPSSSSCEMMMVVERERCSKLWAIVNCVHGWRGKNDRENEGLI
jgi:hypothetical protein